MLSKILIFPITIREFHLLSWHFCPPVEAPKIYVLDAFINARVCINSMLHNTLKIHMMVLQKLMENAIKNAYFSATLLNPQFFHGMPSDFKIFIHQNKLPF